MGGGDFCVCLLVQGERESSEVYGSLWGGPYVGQDYAFFLELTYFCNNQLQFD